MKREEGASAGVSLPGRVVWIVAMIDGILQRSGIPSILEVAVPRESSGISTDGTSDALTAGRRTAPTL